MNEVKRRRCEGKTTAEMIITRGKSGRGGKKRNLLKHSFLMHSFFFGIYFLFRCSLYPFSQTVQTLIDLGGKDQFKILTKRGRNALHLTADLSNLGAMKGKRTNEEK